MPSSDSDSFLSLIVENISAGVCVCHKIDEFPYLRFTVWNQTMLDLTGYTIEEVNRSGWDQMIFSEPEKDGIVLNITKEMKLGHRLHDEEFEILRADGQTRWLSISTSMITDKNNETHIMASMKDVTERKLAAADQEKLIKKLQTSLEEIRRYKTKFEVMALYDSLTGLPNRRLFFDRLNMTLEHNLRHKGMFGLFYLDLDGLKKVNDSLGHAAGDEVLNAVAGRLKNIIRKSDTIARLGGDEFAIIVDQIKSEKEAVIAVEKIIASFTAPFDLNAGRVNVGVSIGISLFPSDSSEAEELIRLADNSMYTSKGKGKSTYTFYCKDARTQKKTHGLKGVKI